jgi:hypothetical protein
MLDHGLIEATGPVPASFAGIGALYSSTLVLATTDLVVNGNSQQQSNKHYAAPRQK